MNFTVFGASGNIGQHVVNQLLAGGHTVAPIDPVYGFDQIVEAHAAMEAGGAARKLVVTT